MNARHLTFAAILIASGLGLLGLMADVLATGGWSFVKALILLCFAGIVPWLGICLGHALTGFAALLRHGEPARPVGPARLPTALAVTIRNEDMAIVLPPLRRLLDGLDGIGLPVGLFILSDTPAPATAEEEAVAAFRAADRDPARIRYRRRVENTGFKAGNVMDFMDHHAEGFDVAIMLDADSEMSADAVRDLVAMMQADPKLGIVQHLTVGRPAAAAFPRLFQFGMRAGMRVWATGQDWWQGREGPYWGHNAALRIAPFRTHCRLAPLPDGSAILSHDQVEAARLCAAGWGVKLWPREEGSQESNPPALPEYLHRDSRWLAGNLQYFALLGLPGFRPMGRWQLVQAILLFAGAPLYTAVLVLAALAAALGQTAGPIWTIALAWTFALYSPKLLGYAQVLADPALRARYGGAGRFAAGAAAEFVFSLTMDAIAQPHKTMAMLRLALGAKAGWLPQNRSDRGVTWTEAARMFWPHTLFGAACFAGFALGGWPAVLWAAPFAGGLVLAVPFCVLTAAPAVSAWLRGRGVAAIPEEVEG